MWLNVSGSAGAGVVLTYGHGILTGFVRDQAVEVLNFHITLAILSVVCFALFFLIIPLIGGLLVGVIGSESIRTPVAW